MTPYLYAPEAAAPWHFLYLLPRRSRATIFSKNCAATQVTPLVPRGVGSAPAAGVPTRVSEATRRDGRPGSASCLRRVIDGARLHSHPAHRFTRAAHESFPRSPFCVSEQLGTMNRFELRRVELNRYLAAVDYARIASARASWDESWRRSTDSTPTFPKKYGGKSMIFSAVGNELVTASVGC